MKRFSIVPLAVVLSFALGGPVLADEATGQVQEIIIKIQTPDGPRWYVLGKDLKAININEGDLVQFDYADDTIESIEVQDVEPEKSKTGTQ
jgi:hypothetical protein